MTAPPPATLNEVIATLQARALAAQTQPLRGRVINVGGPVVRIAYEHAHFGQAVKILRALPQEPIMGQVIAIEGTTALVSPFASCEGISAGTEVLATDTALTVPVGDFLLGRIVDGLGRPIDDLDPFPANARVMPARREAPSPMSRPLIERPMVTGLRAIDSAITLGRGQRVGIFGPPGTGKSSLLAAITQHCDADVIVIGMIGERGREVREFLERQLPAEKRTNVVVVAATSDRTPMERFYGAHVATTIAESFRDKGKSVLLLLDSLTRVARALREIGLAAGEAPTRRGYPASVYPALPELIERTGRSTTGDITAIYTVLVEGDGQADPISEETRSLTDGHIVLSQEIADAGRYPAIDVLKSLSRVMGEITTSRHRRLAAELRQLMAKYAEIEVLLQVGEYQADQDRVADRAVNRMPSLHQFLAQTTSQSSTISETIVKLQEALGD